MADEASADEGIPSEVLKAAADLAFSEGRSIILEASGLVVVPDMTALTAIAHGKDLPDTQRDYTKDGREVLIYLWPGLEAVDQE